MTTSNRLRKMPGVNQHLGENIERQVVASIHTHAMLSGGEKVLIGLSGGPDSTCLLSILHGLRDTFRLSLHALYVDHGMRPGETPREIDFCTHLCKNLDIPFTVRTVDVKAFVKAERINTQDGARQLRYKALEEVAYETGAQKVAVGHTADDQAETVLMHLIRGAGTTGMAGIPPVRKYIIRPLIQVERTSIVEYLKEKNIGHIIDSSNVYGDYTRNRIRRTLIPAIREVNPAIIETLSKTAAIFRDEERYFEVLVTKALMKLISRKTDARIELFLSPLEAMDKVIMRRVLRRAIDATRDLRGIGFVHIESVIELIRKGTPGDRLYLPGGIRAIKEYATLMLTSEPPVKMGTYSLPVPGELVLKEAGVYLKASISTEDESHHDGKNISDIWKTLGLFDADKLTFPLDIRPRKAGDYFYPSGFGKRKKLQDFFVDLKIPRDERERVPLIISGEDIIWIVGYRGDERYKATEKTIRVVKIETKPARF